jgi:hypothetical protein
MMSEQENMFEIVQVRNFVVKKCLDSSLFAS